jgi:hypothetical protein
MVKVKYDHLGKVLFSLNIVYDMILRGLFSFL